MLNVRDDLRGLDVPSIKSRLAPHRTNLSVLISNQTTNLNAGSIVRSCNVFLTRDIIFYGRRDYNRKPCVGSYIYETINVCPDITSLQSWLRQHGIQKIVGIDNNLSRKTIFMHEYEWENVPTLVCFGCEGSGLPDEILNSCDDIVEIKQMGATRSLNVAQAAAVVFYDHFTKDHHE